jgi:hypothetical protein
MRMDSDALSISSSMCVRYSGFRSMLIGIGEAEQAKGENKYRTAVSGLLCQAGIRAR